MSLLDLVISSDTAPVHLAGALGRPVWVLLEHVPSGAGCSIATTVLGIRPHGCSVSHRLATGRPSLASVAGELHQLPELLRTTSPPA